MHSRKMLLTVGFALLLILMANVTMACPSCKLMKDPIAKGFSWSVLFLMGMPFALVGIVGGSLFYIYRRVERSQ